MRHNQVREGNKGFMDNQKKVWKTYLLLFLGVFIFNSIVNIFFYYPNLNDEYNVLSIAACFAGRDWSDFASITKSYHGFGQAIFYVPIFWLLKNPVWIYRAVLVVNAALISLTVPVIYYILERYFDYVKPAYRKICAVTIGTLPFYISYAKNAWNETMCAVVTLLLFVFVLRWMDTWLKKGSNTLNTAVLGCLVGYGYMVHGRMLIFAIVVPMALGLSVLFQSDRETILKNMKSILKYIIIYGALFIVLWLISGQVKGYLYDNLWGHAGLNASVGDFAERKIQYLLSFSNIKVLIKLIMGQIFYMMTTTYGLAIVAFLGGALVLIDGLLSVFGKKERTYSGIECVYAFMMYGSYTAALLLSAVSLLSGTLTEGVGRVDYVLYGRYTENIYPMIIFFAFIFLYKKIIKNEWRFWMICDGVFAFFALFFLRYVVPLYLTLRRTGHSSITNLLPFSGTQVVNGTNEEIFKSFFNVILISLCIMCVIQSLVLWKTKTSRKIVLVCSVLMAVSLYSYGNTMIKRRIPASIDKFQSANGIRQTFIDMGLMDLSDRLYLVMDGTEYPAQYQWAFMDKACVAFFDSDGSKVLENSREILEANDGFVICKYDLNLDFMMDSGYELMDDALAETGYKVWAVGDALGQTLKEKGYTLGKDDTCVYTMEDMIGMDAVSLRTTWLLRDGSYVRTPSMYLPEGSYTLKITGSRLDFGDYNVESTSLNRKRQLFELGSEESFKYTMEYMIREVSDETVTLDVNVNCGARDFQMYMKGSPYAYVMVKSVELIKN